MAPSSSSRRQRPPLRAMPFMLFSDMPGNNGMTVNIWLTVNRQSATFRERSFADIVPATKMRIFS
jgi:hypothetical protein